MAASIRTALQVEAEVVEGDRGEFSVWVGTERVAQKDAHGFPAEADVVEAVRQALTRR